MGTFTNTIVTYNTFDMISNTTIDMLLATKISPADNLPISTT
ncbi:hypothetical protein Mpsy_2908 [Methanolobus psychrophilus R15]|nr:hypothetical protein Mpsy_2908 [Methanolobus psychrophilus R15]